MSLLRGIGKRQIETMMSFVPSMVGFGATGGLAVVYLTDWKLVLQYVPYINGKFKDE